MYQCHDLQLLQTFAGRKYPLLQNGTGRRNRGIKSGDTKISSIGKQSLGELFPVK